MPIRVAQLALLEEKPRDFREAYQQLLNDKKQKAAASKPVSPVPKKNTDRTKVNNLEGKLFQKMRVLEQHKNLTAKFKKQQQDKENIEKNKLARKSILLTDGADKQRKVTENRGKRPFEQMYSTNRSRSRDLKLQNLLLSPNNPFYKPIAPILTR